MRNIPSVLYTLAAVIWLILGLMTYSVIYLGLALVFFVLAVSRRKRGSKEE